MAGIEHAPCPGYKTEPRTVKGKVLPEGFGVCDVCGLDYPLINRGPDKGKVGRHSRLVFKLF